MQVKHNCMGIVENGEVSEEEAELGPELLDDHGTRRVGCPQLVIARILSAKDDRADLVRLVPGWIDDAGCSAAGASRGGGRCSHGRC